MLKQNLITKIGKHSHKESKVKIQMRISRINYKKYLIINLFKVFKLIHKELMNHNSLMYFIFLNNYKLNNFKNSKFLKLYYIFHIKYYIKHYNL